MRLRDFVIWALLVAALCAPAAAQTPSPSPSPPPIAGLQPTTAKLPQVLKLYAAGEAAGKTDAYNVQWSFSESGLKGTTIGIYDGDNYRVDNISGPFSWAEGSNDGVQWYQNLNGYTIVQHGLHKLDTVSDAALKDAVAGKPSPNVTVAGQLNDGKSYVLEVDPPNGRHRWITIDAANGNVTQIVEMVEGRKQTITYDDYRTVKGVTRAWHVHASDGRVVNDYDAKMTAFVLAKPANPGIFAVPPDRRVVVQFPAGKTIVQLPAQVDEGRVIVRVVINGRGLDFQLDSGSSDIVLDTAVAQQLGLKSYGTRTGDTAGSYSAQRAMVPKMSIGDITMSHVAIVTLPFTRQQSVSTNVVGLLGYDFIAGAVVHIDYHDKKVEAIYPASFARPTGKLAFLPIVLDDRVPDIQGGAGGITDSHFILDTGDDLTMIFASFAKAHPDATKDNGKLEDVYGNFADSVRGVGGSFSVQPSSVKDFQVGPLKFNYWTLLVGHSPASFEGDDGAGLIGQDFLAYFDLYLDYPDSMVYLQPTKEFFRDFYK